MKIGRGENTYGGLTRSTLLVKMPANVADATVANYDACTWGDRGDGGFGGKIPDCEKQGLLGEYALSPLLHLPVNTKRQRGDGGIDFTIATGETVDIKTRKAFFGNILVEVTDYGEIAYKGVRADIYVGAWVRRKRPEYVIVEIYGWQTREFIETLPNQRAFSGKGVNKVVEWHTLLNIDDFILRHKNAMKVVDTV